MSRTFCAALFDLDGVLFNTEPLHRRAWIETMHGFGEAIDDAFLMPWTGIPCIELAAHLETSISPHRDRAIYHAAKGDAFRRIVETDLSPFPGALDAVAAVAERFRCTYVTSNDRIDAEFMLRASGYASIIRTGIAYEDVKRHKPDPEPYLAAACLIDVDPSRCLVVEDSPSGVASAKAAGMTVLAVTTSFAALRLEAADEVFPDTISACERLLTMNGRRST